MLSGSVRRASRLLEKSVCRPLHCLVNAWPPMATETGQAHEQPKKERAKSAEARERGERSEKPRKKRKRPKKPVFKNEAEVNVPDRQTLGMLGTIVLMTLCLWVFARAACNAHPPRETRRARVVKTDEFTRDPKAAAVELFQRLGGADFKGAGELVAGEGAAEVEREQKACEANAAACSERRKNAEKVMSVGSVLERDPSTATVRVETTQAGAKQTYLVQVERDTAWKVASWAPDTGQFKAKPPSSASPFNITTRPVAAEDVPPEVRQRYEEQQKKKAEQGTPAPAASH
jgi:hypothetical protein